MSETVRLVTADEDEVAPAGQIQQLPGGHLAAGPQGGPVVHVERQRPAEPAADPDHLVAPMLDQMDAFERGEPLQNVVDPVTKY